MKMVISHSYVKVDAQLQLEDHQRGVAPFGQKIRCGNPRLPLISADWVSPARLLAVSSSLVPGCSISEDGATLPDEQFEQILQPLSVTNSDLQMGRIQGKK